jgi:soluble lytic murein transglycosylase
MSMKKEKSGTPSVLLAVMLLGCCGWVMTAGRDSEVVQPPAFEQATTAPEDKITVAHLNTLPDSRIQAADEGLSGFRGSNAYRLVAATIRNETEAGRPTAAMKILAKDKLARKLAPHEADRLRGLIAQSYMAEGRVTQAYQVAGEAVDRSGSKAPVAAWIAGLAAWRKNDMAKAYTYFAHAAEATHTSPWFESGAAFWAGRAALALGRDSHAEAFFEKAASHPRTFYGLIATRALGREVELNWDKPHASRSDRKALENSALVNDAIQTVARTGNVAKAERLLVTSGWLGNAKRREALLAYIADKNVPALSLHIARMTLSNDGRVFDSALYPDLPWEPESGYAVDSALIKALVRQESRFNPHAKNATGATGLMQLMPSTARYIGGRHDHLKDPAKNIALGQRYIRRLLSTDMVDQDLLAMAVAYNAGPGNLQKWQRELDGINDPLLFIESIPVAETRAFVERVMANYWIYRLKAGDDVRMLDALADPTSGAYEDAARDHDDITQELASRE